MPLLQHLAQCVSFLVFLLDEADEQDWLGLFE